MLFNKNIFFLILFLIFPKQFVFSQTVDSTNLFSAVNRLSFGNYLFKQKDYLRANEEFRAYLSNNPNDTAAFKIAFGNSQMGKSISALSEFKSLSKSNSLMDLSRLYFVRENLKTNNFDYFNNLKLDSSYPYNQNIQMMSNFSKLMQGSKEIGEQNFLSPFPNTIKNSVKKFYERSVNPNYKNATAAGVLSAIIPGSGKIYVGKTGDGITALLVTGLFTFLAVDNFKADHKMRAWIFTGLASAFYAGNIYGSVIAAQQYNIGVQISFGKNVVFFLKKHNYFAPLPKFLFK